MKSIGKLLFGIFLSVSLFSTQLLAQDEKKVTLKFEKTSVKKVLGKLAKEANITIMVNPQVKGKITIHLENAPWKGALRLVVKKGGLNLVKNRKRSYLVTPLSKAKMTFEKAPLKSVLTLLAERAGLSCIISPTVRGKVTLNLSKINPQEGFESVVKAAGYGLVRYSSHLVGVARSKRAKKLQRELKKEKKSLLPSRARKKISLQLKETSLLKAFKELARRLNIEILVDATLKEKISLKVKNASSEAILAILLQRGRAHFSRVTEGVYRVHRRSTVSMEFQDGELSALLNLLARQARANLIISPLVQGNITLALRGASWKKALRAIVEISGYNVEEIEPEIYKVYRKGHLNRSFRRKSKSLPRLSKKKKYQITTTTGTSLVGIPVYVTKKEIWLDVGQGKLILHKKNIREIKNSKGKIIWSRKGKGDKKSSFFKGSDKEKKTSKKSQNPSFQITALRQRDHYKIRAQNIALKYALQKLEKAAGINILIDKEARDRKINLSLDKVHWRTALVVMARGAGSKVKVLAENTAQIVYIPRISMDFSSAPLDKIIDLIVRQAGIDIVIPSSLEGRLSLNLRNVPYGRALKAVLHNTRYKVFKGLGDIYCILPAHFPSSLVEKIKKPVPKEIPLTGKAPAKGITINVKDRPLSQVAKELSKKSGTHISLAGRKDPKVTLNLKKVALPVILEILAEKTRCQVRTLDSNFYLLEEIETVSMEFTGASLTVVLDLLARQGKANILINGRVRGKTSFNLRDTPFEKALKILVLSSGWEVVKDGSNLYRVMPPSKKKERKRESDRETKKRLKKLKKLLKKSGDEEEEGKEEEDLSSKEGKGKELRKLLRKYLREERALQKIARELSQISKELKTLNRHLSGEAREAKKRVAREKKAAFRMLRRKLRQSYSSLRKTLKKKSVSPQKLMKNWKEIGRLTQRAREEFPPGKKNEYRKLEKYNKKLQKKVAQKMKKHFQKTANAYLEKLETSLEKGQYKSAGKYSRKLYHLKKEMKDFDHRSIKELRGKIERREKSLSQKRTALKAKEILKDIEENARKGIHWRVVQGWRTLEKVADKMKDNEKGAEILQKAHPLYIRSRLSRDLTGIYRDGKYRAAIVSGQIYGKGDYILNRVGRKTEYKVKDIGEKEVIFEHKGQTFSVKLER